MGSIEASQYQLVHILQLWYDLTMIQLKTMMNCIDNSGAAVVECVKVMRMKRHAKIGDRVIVVVQKQRNFSESTRSQCLNISSQQGPKRGYQTCGCGQDGQEASKTRWKCCEVR